MLLVALLGACGDDGATGGELDAGPTDGFVDPFPEPDAFTLVGDAVADCQSGEPVCLVRVRGVYTLGEPYGVEPECSVGELGCSDREVTCTEEGTVSCEVR